MFPARSSTARHRTPLSIQPRWLTAAILPLIVAGAIPPGWGVGRAKLAAPGARGSHRSAADHRAAAIDRSDLFARSGIPHQEWYAMTLLGHPVGYTHNSYTRTTWLGKPAYRFTEEFHLQIGPGAGFTTSAVHFTHLNGQLIDSTARRENPGERSVTHIAYGTAVINATEVTTPQKPGAKSTTRRVQVAIPAGVKIAPDTPYEVEPAKVKDGLTLHQWTFDSDRLKIQKQTITLGSAEWVDLPVRGRVQAWRARVHSDAEPDDYFVWVDRKGEAVKVDLPLRGLDVIGLLTPGGHFEPRKPYVPIWKVGSEGFLPARPLIHHPRFVNVLDLSIADAPASLQQLSDGIQMAIPRG